MTDLPIDSYLKQITETIVRESSVILTASPGSGKTTRVPVSLLKASFFQAQKKLIVVLVPKRLAAVSASYRIADENNWTVGSEIGYQVRFEKKYSESTKLIFMTEGVFLKRFSDSRFVDSLSIVIFDEFHERSSLADLALGLCYEHQIFDSNFKLMIMSATLDVSKLKSFLNTQAHIDIVAPPFPLKLVYQNKAQRLICDDIFYQQLTELTKTAWSQNKKDILIFLPGLSEIKKAKNYLTRHFNIEKLFILHSSISLAEQQKLLSPAGSQPEDRRIILSTNIAESSLTLPNLDCVIDSGLEKKSVTEPKIGFQGLETLRISQFSAKQRAGRAARIGSGTAYRMWHASDELSMSEQIQPEIFRSNLQSEVLTLARLEVFNPFSFSWVDSPKNQSIALAQKKLIRWGLVQTDGSITSLGEKIESCPLDIEKSILLVELSKLGFKDQAVSLISCLEQSSFSEIFNQKNVTTLNTMAFSDLDRLTSELIFNDSTKKLSNQLKDWVSKQSFPVNKASDSLTQALIKIFFNFFPEKIAQIKPQSLGVSSLGRGVQFAAGLAANNCDYALLLTGRELNASTTWVDFAVGLSKQEFLELGSKQLHTHKKYEVQFEKSIVYETEEKSVGLFKVHTGTKRPIPQQDLEKIWPDILTDFFPSYIENNSVYKDFLIRFNFLSRFQKELGLSVDDLKSTDDIHSELLNLLKSFTKNISDLKSTDIESYLLQCFPPKFVTIYQQLPSFYILPNNKKTKINYESERAPMISVKIQDIFGQKTNPTIVQGKLILTIELLAPNQRPAQITRELVQFWQTSYHEVKKELKARYPKHPWPDDPVNFIYIKPEKKF